MPETTTVFTEGSASFNEVVRIARAVRESLAEYFDYAPHWSVSQCLMASKELLEALVSANLPAELHCGYYTDCEDEYPDHVARHSLDGLDPECCVSE